MARVLALREEFETVLRDARTVAVLGAHLDEAKPAFYVPEYLYGQGYRILPVNPVFSGRRAWGEPFRDTLTDLDQPVDVVDVFRASRHLPDHLDAMLAMDPSPRTVWMQLGVEHPSVAASLVEHGIDVVQDRCMLADHRSFGLVVEG